MGNQVPSQRSRVSERSSQLSSYMSRRSRRGSRVVSPNSAVSTRERRGSTIGRTAGVGAGGSHTADDEEVEVQRIPSDIEQAFEFARPVEGKMHRNLCGCAQRHTRVDIMSVVRSSGKRTLYVDRQLSMQASPLDVAATETDLKMMCFLATRFGPREACGHPNIIELLGHFSNINAVHIITKYYELGNLLTMLQTALQLQKMSDKTVSHFRNAESLRAIIRDVFQGVTFMHRSGVAHLDLALENIYVGLDGKFRVGDFRHARFVGASNKPQTAPMPRRKIYAAPELYSGREVDLLKADAWSLGIIVLMVITMKTPLAEATTRDPKYQLLQLWGLPKLIEDMSAEHDAKLVIPQDMLDMLSSLLCCNPQHRASVLHAVDLYPWLQVGGEEFTTRQINVGTSDSHTDCLSNADAAP